MLGLANTVLRRDVYFRRNERHRARVRAGFGRLLPAFNTTATPTPPLCNIGEGQSVQTNVAGDQIFTNANGNVFQALNDLANALTFRHGIDAANTEVQQAFSQLTTQRVFYGNALNQASKLSEFLNQEQVNSEHAAESTCGRQHDASSCERISCSSRRASRPDRYRRNS